MILRREVPEDAAAIDAVHADAFSAAADVLQRAGVSAALDMPEAPETRLARQLREDGAVAGLSIVALIDGAVAGHVVCSRGSLGDQPSLGLGPLGVRRAAQGRGVGSALMHAVLGAADGLGESAVFLLGSPAYYRRFGFVAASQLGVRAPDPAWGPHFQGRTLAAWSRALPLRPSEAFAYARAFEGI